MNFDPVRSVEVVEAVRVTCVRGKGIGDDPIRQVTQFWTLDGTLLAEHDPCRKEN